MEILKKEIEIVAPAGDFDKMKAAIKAGANSVYLGLQGFGARRNATNFTVSELKEAIDYAHLRGVRVYLTLNTLMKDIEINNLYENIKKIYEHGIDAFIVQDLGVLKFLRENFPDAEFHASTQMTITNHVEAEFLKSLGIKRVVPARELSFEEIKKIKENTDIDLEVFVSGALCISYSGNCYLSSFVGGRSGNRGLCAQPCRKKYINKNGEESFAISPKDQLLQKEEIEKLQSIGVESIKIEGRMKSQEYVYETVNYYSDLLKENIHDQNRVEKLFNRGYSKGYFYENNNMMNPNFSSDLGYLIAEKQVGTEFLLLDDIMLGDGIIYVDKDYNKITGTYVNNIHVKKNKSGEKLKKATKGEILIFNNIPKEVCYIYRTYDKELLDDISLKLKQEKRSQKIDAKIKLKTAELLELTFITPKVSVKVETEVLELAKKVSITNENIAEKISELGETTFELGKIEIENDGKAFVSFKMLKEIKRKAVEKLEQQLVESYRREATLRLEKEIIEKEHKELEIAVCVRNFEQETAARECGINKIYYKQYDAAREGNLEKIDLTSKLAGSLYQLLRNTNSNVTLDWNFNVGNSYAIEELAKLEKLETVYLSPELDRSIIKSIKSEKLNKGLVIYGCLRSMYIEYPIFDADQELKNENEDEFITLKNNLGNIEIYTKEPLNLIPKLDEIKELNLDEVRLDFLLESGDQVKKILKSIGKDKLGYTPYNYERGVY